MKKCLKRKHASGDLHNKNAYDFLRNLKEEIDEWIKEDPNISEDIKLLRKLPFKLDRYYEEYSYGKAYAYLVKIIENYLAQDENIPSYNLASLIKKLYANDNSILPTTGSLLLEAVHLHSPGASHHEGKLRELVSAPSPHDAHSPLTAGKGKARFAAVIDKNFVAGGLPTIRKYNWNKDNTSQVEYRMPTQARRLGGNAVVRNTFKAFLQTQKPQNASGISHVYFNFLPYTERKYKKMQKLSEALMGEKKKECAMTVALNQLEASHKNTAIITLPADEGLMANKLYTDTTSSISMQAAFAEMLNIAMENAASNADAIRDFHISADIRNKIFAGKDQEEELRKLLENSQQAVGLAKIADDKDDYKLSPAQKQAMWFHFINYELPKYILENLNPAGFNMSCKDAIDRGGVASCWYNLMRSFEQGNIPMSRAEFETGLHGACLYVKGRGLNHHINRIWNAANEYVNTHITELAQDPEKSWLILWRDMNCPKERVDDVLKQRLQTAAARVSATPDSEQKKLMQEIIAEISWKLTTESTAEEKTHSTIKRSHKEKCQLLEILGRSMALYEYKIAPEDNKPIVNIAEVVAYNNVLANMPKSKFEFLIRAAECFLRGMLKVLKIVTCDTYLHGSVIAGLNKLSLLRQDIRKTQNLQDNLAKLDGKETPNPADKCM